MTPFAAATAAWAQDQATQPNPAALPPAAQSAAPPPLPFHPNEVLVWLVIVLVLSFILLALSWLRSAMTAASPKWSLADALSEEADIAYFTTTGPQVDNAGKPVTVSEMRASSSRLIALLGAIVILFLFLGFGTFVLYQYGTTGVMPEVGDILKFMSGGLALFAPYAVNKLSTLGSV